MGLGGGSGSSKSGGGGGRGRPYGMMLILAFGAAVLGVMVVHKLRERRIFNLLIQDKDRHLMSLHLLLQKERDSTKEMKRKIEELKAKMYSLRTQKVVLRNKFMEMQSMTTSLKEEQRALEWTIEEKQNEIKMLKEKERDSKREDSQVIALTEFLKQKEAEIKIMKSRLEKSINIRSVSKNNQDGEGLGESSEAREKNAEESQVRVEVSGQKVEKSKDHRDDEGFGMRGEKGNRNTMEVVDSSKRNEVRKTKDESGDTKAINGQSWKLDNTQDGERLDGSRSVGSRVRGEYGYRRLKRGSNVRIISRDAELKKNGSFKGVGVSMRGKRWRANESGHRNTVTGDKKGEDLSDDSSRHARKEDETASKDGKLEKLNNSKDGEGLEVVGINGKYGEFAIDDIEQKTNEELRQSEGQEVKEAFDIKHNGSEGTKGTNGEEEPKKLEVADDAVSNEANYKLKEDEEEAKYKSTT